ncbi:MAG TPA: hypothetical protein VFV53_00270 [Candidatus Limnocylindrales bacterium]|nr:hypothetical protein [Candidatus Limnocylindrales bacterium]
MVHKTSDRRRQRNAVASRHADRDASWRIEVVHGSNAVVGPDVAVPDVEEVLRAIEKAPRPDDWDALRRIVVPVFPRVRPYPRGTPPPLTTILSPGVVVGFGADIGPAFMTLNEPQLETLGVKKADVVAAALANLLARADALDRASIIHGDVADVPIAALQSGVSIGSTLVLAPDQVRRLFGPAPMLFIAPMRDLLIGFPADVDGELAGWVFKEIADQDPNCLAPVAYRFDGAQLTAAALAKRPSGPAGPLA